MVNPNLKGSDVNKCCDHGAANSNDDDMEFDSVSGCQRSNPNVPAAIASFQSQHPLFRQHNRPWGPPSFFVDDLGSLWMSELASSAMDSFWSQTTVKLFGELKMTAYTLITYNCIQTLKLTLYITIDTPTQKL